MKNMKIIKGIFYLAAGAFFIYWAQSHSPNAGLGEKLANQVSDSYTMSEPWYYVSLVAGSVMAIIGIITTYKAVK